MDEGCHEPRLNSSHLQRCCCVISGYGLLLCVAVVFGVCYCALPCTAVYYRVIPCATVCSCVLLCTTLCTVSGRSSGPGMFNFNFGGLCVTPRGTLLLAEGGNHRVQEINPTTGAHLRFIGVHQLNQPHCVDVSGDALVVSETTRISVFFYGTGR